VDHQDEGVADTYGNGMGRAGSDRAMSHQPR
jgi:hypothetical protein